MFKGVITPMVAPFHRNEKQSINYEATNQLVEHLIPHHLHGIFLLGTNGEFHVVSQQEKLEFTAYVVKLVNKRIPVFSGMRSCCLTEAIEMAKTPHKQGQMLYCCFRHIISSQAIRKLFII